MSKSIKFCPNCGSELHGSTVCPNCGYGIEGKSYKPPTTSSTKAKTKSSSAKGDKTSEVTYGQENSIWNAFSPYMPKYSKYVWLILIIGSLINLLWAWIPFIFVPFPWWEFFSLIANVIIIFVYVQPVFVKHVAIEEYKELLDDVFVFGNIRFPKVLFFGILTAIFGYGWLGSALLIPAVLIVFFGPYPFQWTIETS
ncbi:MAG: hypothetical protein ACTSRZ_12300 [Promethearchaeota archaeon]